MKEWKNETLKNYKVSQFIFSFFHYFIFYDYLCTRKQKVGIAQLVRVSP